MGTHGSPHNREGVERGRPMRRFIPANLLLIAGLFLVCGPVFAHHGGAEYDRTKTLNLKGTVTEFRFINPHVLFKFEVKDDQGDVEEWQGEVSNPLQLARQGWNRKTFKPGDQVTFIGNPTKSGVKSMWINRIILANGEDAGTLHNTY
jgi:hypothetical protein